MMPCTPVPEVSRAMSVALPYADAQAVSKADFREAMSRLAAAVNVITTDGPGGRCGFTASAVCSVTDDPPTLLVCLNKNASVYGAVKQNGTVCVNTLAAGHQQVSNLFGGKTPMDERFAAAQWKSGVTGSPVLENAVVSFDCVVTRCTEIGTHDVLFCEVRGLFVGGSQKALMYFGRQYHELIASH